jgi:hypothetical protein
MNNLPEFPVSELPLMGKEIVERVAEVIQVDTGLVAGCYLGVLAIALQKKFEVNLGTHTEPLCLYICNIAESGHRKSPAFKEMSSPIYEFQKEETRRLSDSIMKSEANNRMLLKKRGNLEEKMAKTLDGKELKKRENELNSVLSEIKSNPLLKKPIFIVDDITPESLGVVMSENRERLGLMSAEGGIFQTLAGRYNSKIPNLDLVLKAFSGDSVCCHRIGRDAVDMHNPALSMCVNVQPDVISEIGEVRQFRGKGLLARYLFWRCKHLSGFRFRQLKVIDESLKNAYRLHLSNLISISLGDETKKLNMESNAQKVWDSFYNLIETSMQPSGDLYPLDDWGSKLPGTVARIAGLLHMAKNGADGGIMDIEADTVESASKIGLAYKKHALFVFGMMKEVPEINSAKLILKYLKANELTKFNKRDVLRNVHAFNKADEVKQGIPILIENGYIRKIKQLAEKKPGRPQADEYEVNPETYL